MNAWYKSTPTVYTPFVRGCPSGSFSLYRETQSPPPFCGVMATLMEFAAASLERDGGSRALDGSVPPAVVTPPVLHWGSAGRRALDADGKRCVKVAARATLSLTPRRASAPPTRGGGVRTPGVASACADLPVSFGNEQLLVIASKGAGTRAAEMTLDSARLRKEGMLVLDELSMRGGALSW